MLNRRRFIAGTSAAVAGSVAASTGVCADETEAAADADRNERATVIAHRGFAETYPEYTVAAFELAVQGGADDAARIGSNSTRFRRVTARSRSPRLGTRQPDRHRGSALRDARQRGVRRRSARERRDDPHARRSDGGRPGERRRQHRHRGRLARRPVRPRRRPRGRAGGSGRGSSRLSRSRPATTTSCCSRCSRRARSRPSATSIPICRQRTCSTTPFRRTRRHRRVRYRRRQPAAGEDLRDAAFRRRRLRGDRSRRRSARTRSAGHRLDDQHLVRGRAIDRRRRRRALSRLLRKREVPTRPANSHSSPRLFENDTLLGVPYRTKGRNDGWWRTRRRSRWPPSG